MSPHFVEVIYCSDVQERSGSAIPIGLYAGEIELTGPGSGEKVFAMAKAVASAAVPFRSVTFRLSVDAEIVDEITYFGAALISTGAGGSPVISHIFELKPYWLFRQRTLSLMAIIDRKYFPTTPIRVEFMPPF